MDKKNIFKLIAIVLVVLSILGIAFLLSGNRGENNNNVDSNGTGLDKPNPPVTDHVLSYDDVYSMALSLYGGDNVNIELEEETDRYVIKRIYKATGVVERYYVDKETGFISTDVIIMESVVTG